MQGSDPEETQHEKNIKYKNHQVLQTRYQQPCFNEGLDEARECDDNDDYVGAVNT